MTQRYKELEDLRNQVDDLRGWADLTWQPLPMGPTRHCAARKHGRRG